MGVGVFGLLCDVCVVRLLPNGGVGWLMQLCSAGADQVLRVLGTVGLRLDVVSSL